MKNCKDTEIKDIKFFVTKLTYKKENSCVVFKCWFFENKRYEDLDFYQLLLFN